MSTPAIKVIEHALAKAINDGDLPIESWRLWKAEGILSMDEFDVLLEKAGPGRKEVWNQTVAFLAGHGDKKYQRIHEGNQARQRTESGEPAQKPKGPDRKGERGEVAKVKGAIVNKRVGYPLKDQHGKETGETGYRQIKVQQIHHFKHTGTAWEHTHTTTEGAGLNAK